MSEYFLRELTSSDIPSINKWRNDSNLVSHLGAPFRYINIETDTKWFEGYLQNRSNAIRLAICRKSDAMLIGAVYLLNIDWLVRQAEFAIWIGDETYQGKGVGKFAIQEVLKHAFLDLNFNRVYLTALIHNCRAINLYEKIGFKKEGVIRQGTFKEGRFIDLVMMSILREDYGHD